MNMPIVDQTGRIGHHLAYLCFLPPILLSTISGLSKVITMDTGTAGGIGLLVLVPLALLALVSIPAGIVMSIKYRKDYMLLVLSVVTVLYVVEIMTEAGTTTFYNVSLSLYGIAGIVLLASWFLFRRKRYYPVT